MKGGRASGREAACSARAGGWVVRRSQSSGGASSRRCSAGKEEEDRREGEKPQRANGWYIADQYNCTLVLINNRRWERKKRAMQQRQRCGGGGGSECNTQIIRDTSAGLGGSAYQTAPSPLVLAFFPLPCPRSHSLALALSVRAPGPPPFFPSAPSAPINPGRDHPTPSPGTAISGQINSSRRNFYAGPSDENRLRSTDISSIPRKADKLSVTGKQSLCLNQCSTSEEGSTCIGSNAEPLLENSQSQSSNSR